MVLFTSTHQPKKSLGQNFLTSEGAIVDILQAAEVKKDDIILEIGPGKGVLTRKLLEAGAVVTAVEKDESLVEYLRELFSVEIKNEKLVLIEGDILELNVKDALCQTSGKYKLIANIPYYITGQIFRMFLESDYQPTSATLLVQREVAERVVARDGKESILSMSVKVFGNPTYISTVKRGSFNPAPNVDSAILHIADISKKHFLESGASEKRFFEILKVAFAHKRKKISGNLKVLFKDSSVLCLQCGILENARAEDLHIEHFLKLASYR